MIFPEKFESKEIYEWRLLDCAMQFTKDECSLRVNCSVAAHSCVQCRNCFE